MGIAGDGGPVVGPPPLANRMGKLRLVVLTQGLSIPFMIMLGFFPIFCHQGDGLLRTHGLDEYVQPDLPELCT